MEKDQTRKSGKARLAMSRGPSALDDQRYELIEFLAGVPASKTLEGGHRITLLSDRVYDTRDVVRFAKLLETG